jgi:hypothetical protein
MSKEEKDRLWCEAMSAHTIEEKETLISKLSCYKMNDDINSVLKWLTSSIKIMRHWKSLSEVR